ncbi:hypothetical protein BTHERMOSOX_958 [Bathymodiolus thermophilus thioautotrophic gill symbiont]|uniref:hypothetical protein n=1 Tax=Bathymodiolus thermophilus thioautotrophic gill symbiont TaxID=2360 RepID=UPI0010B73243|nr:hypothetical protein [Bathymodiolus thermophilus thioautotrophic gill symbiont]SHA27091.1 hypothetical protein BTHERMOSOX_958 [Bathymodiolus thermophilus thioautotrophic gill symbiont]
MNTFNRFIVNMMLLLSTQALATNTIDISNTPTVPEQPRVNASAQLLGLTITAKKRLGASGNILYISIHGAATNGCKFYQKHFNNTYQDIACGQRLFYSRSSTADLANYINTLEFFSSSPGSSAVNINTEPEVTLSGGKDAVSAKAQVTIFTPTSANTAKTYTITINNIPYITQVNASTPIKAIVEALQAKVTTNTAITCTEDGSKIICTANTANTAFTYATSVADR